MTEREIFFEALEIATPEARAGYLQGACGQDVTLRRKVDELLKEHFSNDSLLAGPAMEGERTAEFKSPVEEAPAQMLGRYKLLEKIGEGGFGEVWMAEQREPIKRRVALKIIKLGMDSRQIVARFEAERQALAMMDHANIAKVFDAGTTDSGRLYFVMELVRGIKITEYCDQNQLPTRERLRLFILVCHAIQHAHQKGIIHRDIKPSNILVTLHDGVPVPKVIDFGIAKATQQELTDKTVFTQFQQFIGTPAYISPEQAEMSGLDIDTRADIYSLGVLLYELLVGQTPFDAKEMMQGGLDALRQIIREREPLRPSTRLATLAGEELTTTAKRRSADTSKLLHQLKGDLDWIVMKCLEKDRTRRYDTANGLAADIQRHLANEPVVARPPSAAYKLSRFARRNKGAVAAAGAIAAVLIAATIVSSWSAFRAGKAEKLARERLAESERARMEAETIAGLFRTVFESPEPTRNGRTVTVAETLDLAVKMLETDLATQPARRADMQVTLGTTYNGLGLAREAAPLFEKARDYYLTALGPDDPRTLTAITGLAHCSRMAGRRVEALKLHEEVLALRQKVLGPEHRDTLSTMSWLANSYAETGRQDEAFELHEKVLALYRKVFGPEDRETVGAMGMRALSYANAGKGDEALKISEEVLALHRKISGPEHPNTLWTMLILANSYANAGRREEALKLQEEILALGRKVFGPEHPYALWAMLGVAGSYANAGRREEALKLQEELLPLCRKVQGPEHPDTLSAMMQVAGSYANAGRREEALKLQEELLPLCRKVQGPEHPDTLWVMGQLANSYAHVWRVDEVLKLREEILALTRKSLGPEHATTLGSARDLAITYERLGRKEDGMKLREEIRAIEEKAASTLPPLPQIEAKHLPILRTRAHRLARNGKWKEAAADLQTCLRLDPTPFDWYALAPLLLQIGDLEGYRAHRRAMLDRFGSTKDLVEMGQIAKPSLLLPAEGSELEKLAALAEAAVTQGKDHEHRRSFQLAKALAEYRCGRFAESATFAKQVLESRSGVTYREIQANAILAMAEQRLTHTREAHSALARADALAADWPKVDGSDPNVDFGEEWSNTLMGTFLLREAHALPGEN